ncbi:hypothetical protein GCM10009811_28220 [Nostocoides veronense]|uniref:Uncharacterized protein n=1 Tax=Nostocoides veronense TaxID=330836 RepID=A0ABN2LY28_9MICO
MLDPDPVAEPESVVRSDVAHPASPRETEAARTAVVFKRVSFISYLTVLTTSGRGVPAAWTWRCRGYADRHTRC